MRKPKLKKPRLAINLLDVERVDPAVRGMLFGGKLDLSKPVRVDPSRADEIGVAFTCDDLTAACICDIVRDHDRRAKDPPARVYLFRQVWARVPGAAALTIMVNGKPALNPEWFAGTAVEGPPPALGEVAL